MSFFTVIIVYSSLPCYINLLLLGYDFFLNAFIIF